MFFLLHYFLRVFHHQISIILLYEQSAKRQLSSLVSNRVARHMTVDGGTLGRHFFLVLTRQLGTFNWRLGD